MLKKVGIWRVQERKFDRKGILTFQIKDRHFSVPEWGPKGPGIQLDIIENGVPVGVAYQSKFCSFWHLKVDGRHYFIRHTNPEYIQSISGYGEVEVSV